MAFNPVRPFKPCPAGTTVLTVTSASVAAAFPIAAPQVMISTAPGAPTLFLEMGLSTVSVTTPTSSTAGGTPVLGGMAQVFGVPPGATHMAILAATTAGATAYLTMGEGM